MTKKDSGANKLAQMRLMLQAQQRPQLSMNPVDSVGAGISQGANNLVSGIMQGRQSQMLQNLLAKQQQAELDAEKIRQESYKPLEGLTGMPASTLANQDSSVLNTLIQDGLRKSEAIAKAQNLQEQFGRVQPGINDPNFLNLNADNGYNMSGEQAALIAGNPQAYQAIAEASAAALRVQMLQEALNALVPDRSTLGGQKDYRNTYQEFFGNEPVTDVKMQQEQANLQNTLLGNQGQGITNRFMPLEKQMGLINSNLDAEGKGIENRYKPLLNDASLRSTYAGIDSTEAGTIGKNIDNEQKANDLQLENQILSVMNDTSIPIERRTAIVSTLQKDPQKLVSTLSQLSQKGGVLGSNAKDFKAAMDLVTSETNARLQPKPQAVNQPAAPKAMPNPRSSNGVYYDRGREFQLGAGPKTLGDVFGAGLRSIFTPDPNAPGVILSNQLKQQNTAPQPAPKRPVTLPGIQAAKQKAQAGANSMNSQIASKQATVNTNNSYLQQAESLLGNLNEQEKKRRQQAQGILRY